MIRYICDHCGATELCSKGIMGELAPPAGFITQVDDDGTKHYCSNACKASYRDWQQKIWQKENEVNFGIKTLKKLDQ